MSKQKNIFEEFEDVELHEPFSVYSFEILADIFLGIALGIIVNFISSCIAKLLDLSIYAAFVIQLILIIIVLYVLKIDSKYLYGSWKGQTNYGIIFTAIFLAVQRNLIRFFELLYQKEDKVINYLLLKFKRKPDVKSLELFVPKKLKY